MTLSSFVHRFLFSIVAAAPFYNLMKASEYKFYIIAAVLTILNFIFYISAKRAKKSVLFRPVSLRERKEFLMRTRNRQPAGPVFRSNAGRDSESRLSELKNLYDKGLITESEYSDRKKDIINGI